MYDLVSDFHMISWMNSAHYQVQPEEEVKNLHSHISHSDTFSKTELQDLTRISPNVGCWVWQWAVLHPPSSSDVILNVMLNLQCVSCCFYSAADSLFQSRGHCVQLTYGYCAFSAMVDSLAEWIELWGTHTHTHREKLRMSNWTVCFLPFICSWLWPWVCALRCRSQPGHAAETAGAANPSTQQHPRQLACPWWAAQDLVPPRVLQRGVRSPITINT